MEILHWKISPELKKETENNYRHNFSINLKDAGPMKIIHELAFDGVADDIEISDIEKLFNFVEKNFLKKKIEGIGLEVGAGPAALSSVLAEKSAVKQIYALEVCEPIVEILMPKVVKYILGKNEEKIIGVIGDFDNLKLPDSSLDFIFDFFSLHHSGNLGTTLKECGRVLKPGGFVLCFDKARPDFYSDADLNELMDTEYGEKDKARFGVLPDIEFTRRMNGEKEYRLKDWKSVFANTGFSAVDYFYLAKPISQSLLSRIVKNFLATLPSFLQMRLNKLLPPPDFGSKFALAPQNRIFTRLVNKFPKEISLLIAYK